MSGFGRFLRRRALHKAERDLGPLIQQLSSSDWTASIAGAIEGATHVPRLANENVRDHLSRACGVARGEVDRFFEALRRGLKPAEADKAIFGRSPTLLSDTLTEVFNGIRHQARNVKVAAGNDGANQARISIQDLIEHGWDPIRDPIMAVRRHTGIEPSEGEPIFSYLARAAGCSLARVQVYMALMDKGVPPETADRHVFGGGPSPLLRALEAARQAQAEFAVAVDAARQRPCSTKQQ